MSALGIQVISRAAKILDALGNRPDGMSLGEIAQAVDLPRSTVQRIVAALDSVQLVRSPGAGGVRLGPALLRLIATLHTDVVAIAQPWLQALCDATGETVSWRVPADCSWRSCIMWWPIVSCAWFRASA